MDEETRAVWTAIPDDETINATMEAMTGRGITAVLVETKEEGFEKLKEIIPGGVDVMTGSSTTLYECGFMDYYIQGPNPWNCLGPAVFNEPDPVEQQRLRRQADCADYFVASVNAVTAEGQLVAVDRSGSRVGAFPFVAPHLVLLVGIQKIVPDLDAAMRRVKEYVFYLEDERSMQRYGIGTKLGKWVIIESEGIPGRITVVLCKEPLGF